MNYMRINSSIYEITIISDSLPDPDYERNRKRIVYDPSQHNYGSEAPTMREIRGTFRTMFGSGVQEI